MLHDCQSCPWRICSLEYTDYLKQSQTTYCRVQILWMLKHSDLLNDGVWPEARTGYIDTHEDVQTSTPQHAPHEGTLNEWAEVMVRLEATGQDGQTLQEEINSGLPEPVSSAAWKALGYAGNGPKRRRETYSHWKDRKYGKKGVRV